MLSDVLSNIQWLGHDGFAITTGDLRLVIDPYQLAEAEPADIILITHPHFDHCSSDDIEKVKKPSTIFVTEAESAKKLAGDVRVVKPGDRLNIMGIDIEAVPAYNTDKDFHPKNNGWLGFIITIDGVRVYHAGDTDLIPEMENLSVDIALLPVSGTYVMTAAEAIEAAKKIKPKVAIPMHYDAIVGTPEDAAKFRSALEGVCEVVVLEK
jgi:L-ascorbate metabolism protein UlaG (beta-lactamase superfamily)